MKANEFEIKLFTSTSATTQTYIMTPSYPSKLNKS